MDFESAAAVLKDIPHTRPHRGRVLYDFVRESGARDILELGFAHGVSACYFAAALDEIGAGSVLTIDNQSAKQRVPSISTLLEQMKLGRFVRPIFADTSYTWELMKLIEERTTDGVCRPHFDLCFIDGAHLWEVDGFSFFLVEKLLKPGGWILFDDLYWTFAEGMKGTEAARLCPEDQGTTAQVERVFSLLVHQHPGFENAVIHDGWGWARKKSIGAAPPTDFVDAVYAKQSIKSDLLAIVNKVRWHRRLKQARGRPR